MRLGLKAAGSQLTAVDSDTKATQSQMNFMAERRREPSERERESELRTLEDCEPNDRVK